MAERRQLIGHDHTSPPVGRHPSPVLRSRCAVLAVLVCCLLPAACSTAQELLANGGFEALGAEGGAESWGIHNWGDGKLVAANVVGKALFGQRCLELKSTAGPILFGCYSHPISLGEAPPAQLLLTLWYRADADAQPEVSLVTFAQDFATREWETPVLTSEAVTLEPSPKQWRSMTWRVRPLPAARQAMVLARIHGPGSLSLDGVSLRAYPAEVECTLLSPGEVTEAGGNREARVRLLNRSDAALPVRVALDVNAPKLRRKTTQASARLTPGKPEEVTLAYTYPLSQAAMVTITVTSEQGDTIYDEIRDSVPGLIDGWITVPAFRSTILPGIPPAEIAARGVVNATPELRRQLKLSGKLVGIGQELPDVPLDDTGHWQVRVPLGAMLTGTYAVHLQAAQGGRTIAEFDLPVVKPEPRAGLAGYDERMRYYLGDQMRLPLGVLMAIEEADLTAVAEAGFNTVVLPSRLASTAMMEAAQRLGLAVIVSSANADQEFWQNQLTRHDGQPSLGGWYLLQRPETESPPVLPIVMGAIYSGLVELDPRRPACLAVGSLSHLEHYSSLCDILMPWTEPEPVGELRGVDALVSRAAELCAGRRPVWPIVQMTGAAYATDSRRDPAADGRPPTAAEYRCMVYLALARGGQGVFSNAYRVATSRNQRDYLVSRDAPDLWAGVRRVNQELRALTPVLLTGEPLAVTTDNPRVAVRGFRYNDVYYVLAANPLAVAAPLTLRVPGMQTNILEVAFDTRRVQGLAAGEFADQIEPHGVRVYMGR